MISPHKAEGAFSLYLMNRDFKPAMVAWAVEVLCAGGGGESGEREYLKALMRQEIGSMPEDRTAEESARVVFYLDLMESLDRSRLQFGSRWCEYSQ